MLDRTQDEIRLVSIGIAVETEIAAIADQHFVDSTCNPLIELISEAITRQLAPRFESRDDLIIWLERCRANDPEQRLKERQHLARHGYITANESPAMLDLLPFVPNFRHFIASRNDSLISVDHMFDRRLRIEASFDDQLTISQNGLELITT